VGEAQEAVLVVIRGAVCGLAIQRCQRVITLDDGSGPAKVLIYPGVGATTSGIQKGAGSRLWGGRTADDQAEPTTGYRIWPRLAADMRLVASATSAATAGTGASGTSRAGGSANPHSGGEPGSPPAPGTPAGDGIVILSAPEGEPLDPTAPAFPDETAGRTPPAPTIPLLGSSLAAMGLLGVLMARHGTAQRVAQEVRRRLAELREFDD
jgi:hypothetical protein